MVREHDRRDRPHLVSKSLQREHRSRVAHVPVGDRRLNRQDLHPPILPRRSWPCSRATP
ncbi:hypothetical protein ACFPRL_18275 [Pseudoclavibacter helvolus]